MCGLDVRNSQIFRPLNADRDWHTGCSGDQQPQARWRSDYGLSRFQSQSEPYVTVVELAAYWLVGRKQIYKQIDAGTLPAIRLGPRLLRIRTSDAQAFERSANMRVSQETPHAKTA